ncbi:MAG TPA: carbohydrate kinase [Marinagarivorans sp.]
MKATVFGEVLFDIFPDQHAVPGGAPFNVAWHLNAFDIDVDFVSRIGQDEQGKKLQALMQDNHFPMEHLQVDASRPTGYVNVTLDDGEPSYSIAEQVAYDAISAPKDPCESDLLYHGTLALRCPESAKALEALRDNAKLVFMDVNLRDPYWEKETTLALAKKADWLKINADEFRILAGRDYCAEAANELLNTLELEGVLVTLGSEGACVYTQEQSQCASVIPKPQDDICDTVGAGDAFSAVFIFGLLQHWPMQAVVARAQSFASQVITIPGAISSDPDFYDPFKQAWQTESISNVID